jgi:O-antigen ligase
VGKYLTGRLHVPRFPPMTWVPTAGFVAVVVASGLWAASTSGWVFAMGQVGLALAYFAVHALLIDHPSQVEGLLKVYVVGAVFAAGYGFAQAAADLRAEGLQGDANIYALYQVAAVPALLALVKATHGWQRALWALTAIPILYSVVASQSRGALLALIATAIVLAIMSPRRRLLLPLGAVAALVIFTVAPYIDDRYAPERVSADRASGRIDIWFSAWQLFLDHPFTGIGAGNFVGRSIDLLTTTPGVELVKSHLLTGRGIEVHNIYLESLAERGIFGLLTLVVLLLTALAALLIAAQRFRTPAVEALAPMMVAFCVAAFFLSVANSKLLWMLIGVAAALLAIRPTDERPAERPQALTRSIS